MDTRKVFRSISNKMLEDFEISAEIKHQGSKGTFRENALKSFLTQGRLPSRYRIGAGEVVGPAHNVSRQSDLIIYDQLDGVSLIFDESTQVYPIECVAGVIEVKSTLSKSEFIDSLENIKSLKRLVPEEVAIKPVSGGMTVAYNRPMPFGAVFGYRLEGNSLSSLVENLKEWERETPKKYWPNLVAVLDEGLIHHFRAGLKIACANDDLKEASFPAYISYGKDSLFKFYATLIDLCASTHLGPVVLSRYFDQAEQLGDLTVSNHDRIQRLGKEEVFKLSIAFINKVVSFCQKVGPISQEQLLLQRLGQIPLGMDDAELKRKVFLYNPDGLKGIHEIKNAIVMENDRPIAAKGVMEPCHYIQVNGETYYFPWIYVLEDDIEVIPGRTKKDL